jgi:ATP-dependent Clp protease ATP-binding subunit ClpA
MFSDVFPCFHDLQADLFSRLRNAGFFRPEFLNRLDEIIAPGRKQR